MPPRHQPLPPAQTASARTALQSFYCTLCSKGYSRMNEYEAHLGSYDHSHKQRQRDMKGMLKNPGTSEKARRAEAKANGIFTIKIESAVPGEGGSGFKKGGFKKVGFKSAFAPAEGGGGDAEGGDAPGAAATVDRPSAANPPRLLDHDEQEAARRARAGLAHGQPEVVDENGDSDSDDEYEVYDPANPTD